MESTDFEKQMENLKIPSANTVRPPVEIKLAIVNAERSAVMGFWFITIPCYFFFCVFMKFYFQVNLGIFDSLGGLMRALDQNPYLRFLSPFLMVGLPLLGVVLNALAITHFSYQESSRMLQIRIRLRWANLIVLFVSLALVSVFLLYAIVENLHHN